MELVVEAYDGQDDWEFASLAKVKMTPELYDRIKELYKVVKELGVQSITETSYVPDWYEGADKLMTPAERLENAPEWVNVQCVELVVTRYGGFRWQGYVKHTTVMVRTETLYIEDMEEGAIYWRRAG